MKTLYFDNYVDAGVVAEVKKAVETDGVVRVSFDVMGRTLHECLGAQLHHELGDDYEADIEYWMYKVEIRKRGGAE